MKLELFDESEINAVEIRFWELLDKLLNSMIREFYGARYSIETNIEKYSYWWIERCAAELQQVEGYSSICYSSAKT